MLKAKFSKNRSIEASFYEIKEWLLNGLHHREDGFAVEWKYGFKEYYLHGQYYASKSAFNKAKSIAKKDLKNVKC